MSFAFIAMGVFLGIYAFFANATTWTVWGINWDNDNYLSGSFRDESPTDYDIITALYGTGDEGSVYTQNWTGYNSGTCLSGGMTVEYTGNLIWGTLSSNTIYVLTWPTAIATGTINMAECSAIVSNHNSSTIFQSDIYLSNGMFYANNTNNIIFENITINGTWWGIAPSHLRNVYWIRFSNNYNTTLHNIDIYNSNEGISLISLQNNDINTTSIYDNGMGIYIDNVNYLFLHNSEIYNNDSDWGIFAEWNCIECDLNNINVYNNSIWISSRFTWSTFTNIEIHETTSDGLNIQGDNNVFENVECYSGNNWIVLLGDNNILSWIQTHNNLQYWIRINQWDNNTLHNSDLNNNAIGLLIYSWSDNTITYSDFYENQNGLSLNNASNNDINNNNIYSNTQNGFSVSLWSHYNTSTNNNIYENNRWINFLNNCTYNTISGTNVYNNTLQWLVFSNTCNYNNIRNSFFSWNSEWISLSLSDNNTFVDIESNNNENSNISISYSHNNTFIDITANGSQNAMWVYLSNSSNNNFMWLYTSGNYYAWVHFYNSYNNTWTAIVSNSNEWWLYMENSTGNVFENATIENNTKNGVMFVSGSNDNILSWAIVSGNMNHGIYMSNSNDNTLYDVTSNNSYRIWLLIETGNNNIVNFSTFNNNGLWIYSDGLYLDHNSWTIISNTTISGNKNTGIRIEYWNNNEILQSNIENNTRQWIHILWSHTNTISWCTLSWWTNLSIEIINSNNNNITNSTGDLWLDIMNSTWTNITMTSIYSIWEQNDLWLFLYTTYDPYTINNNNISIVSYDSNIAYITWITLPIWSIFDTYFDFLYMQTNLFPNPNNEITIYPDGLTISGSAWDGNIYLPTPIIAWTKLAELSETWINNIVELIKTIEIISGDTYLTIINEWVWFAKYVLDSWISGQYLKILKSTDWNTWTDNTDLSWCILDENSICEFDFMGDIKLFAFWVPTWSFTGTTETWAIVTSGWVYTTDITITYENPNLSWATLNGVAYASGDVISGDNIYVFEMEDTFGNTTGMTFTIDTTPPTFTGTTLTAIPVVHNGYYTTWITITFDAPDLSGATLNGVTYFSGDLITGDDIYSFVVKDIVWNTTGMLFTIDTTNPIVTGDTPISWAFIDTSSNVDFSRSVTETNISWYTLYINWTETHTINLGNTNTHTISLPDGSYTRYIVAHDLAGNMWSSSVKGFTILVPLSTTMTFLTWNLYYNAARYTNDNIDLALRTNKLANYLITGDITLAPFTSTINGSVTGSFLLTGSDGIKTVYAQVTDGVDTIGQNFSIRLDTSAPTLPTLLSPISGAIAMWSFTLDWSDSLDAGAGTSWYYYTVLSTWIYGSVVKSGFTDMNTSYVTIAEGELGPSGTYYRYVTPVDRLWNTGSTSMQYFEYSWTTDTTPNSFTFTDIDDALINRTYTSNTITITGMTANVPVLASVNRWALYISWVFVGSTWYVQNGWTVSVELISSIDYEDTVSSTLTINWVSDTFSVTTEEDDGTNDYDIESTLSNTEKLMIIAIFDTLRDVYAGDKEVEFFNTFMVMLENRIDDYNTDDPEYESLTYLYDLIQEYYDGAFDSDTIDWTRWIVNGIYTAPNGKKYPITYDSSKQRFTSSNFVVPKYFPTLDTLKYIIDINNPVWSSYANSKAILARWKNAAIDGTRQSSPYTAPNKKTFYFFKTITGRYSSYTFTSERYFDSLDATKEFIYNNNK